MTVIAMSSAQTIDLDLSGVTTVLAVILALGSVVLLAWMWKLGHRLEGGKTATPPQPERSATTTDATVA